MPYKDPRKKKEHMQKWWADNREHVKQYRQDTKEKRSETHRAWRLANKEKRNADMREWRSIPGNKLASNMRSRISNVLTGRSKAASTLDFLGCSWDEFKSWLSGWFDSGMTWENYGDWEVDHSRPCDSFDLADPEQQKRCFHYLNLRPLWKSDNRRKGPRYVV